MNFQIQTSYCQNKIVFYDNVDGDEDDDDDDDDEHGDEDGDDHEDLGDVFLRGLDE